MRLLITGVAGFVGYHCAQRLLDAGCEVTGTDNLNAYYSVALKQARLQHLQAKPGFVFQLLDLGDRDGMAALFRNHTFDAVLHLGAQAGVRWSIEHPHAYLDSNLAGTLNVLEGCRHSHIAHCIYASSSSVYGANTKVPFAVEDRTDNPVSLYGATKKATEILSESYAQLYRLPLTGLRFFTVYGPWGRPDMAYYKFAQAITAGQPIDVYNNGQMERDFTYIDDIVDAIQRLTLQPPAFTRAVPHRLYNLGHNHPETLGSLIELLEKHLGQSAQKRYLPMQPGDVVRTYADIDRSRQDLGFAPQISLDEGLRRFVEWFQSAGKTF